MLWLDRLRRRVAALVRKRELDRELDWEMRHHIALETEALTQSGVSPDDARRRAHAAFGGVELHKERVRDARGMGRFERISQNVAYAARSLRNHFGFSAAAVLSLGLGIGVSTVIFTMLYSVALRPLPVRGADRIVNVYQQFHGKVRREVYGAGSLISYPEFLAYSDAAHSLESSAVYSQTEFAFGGSREETVRADYVSCGYFRTLRASIVLGRAFSKVDCANSGAPPVAVISYGLWQRQFGGAPNMLGRTIELNHVPVTVVGISEVGFAGVDVQRADTWVPVTSEPLLTHGTDSLLTLDASWMTMVARLAAHATIGQARAELSAAAQRRNINFPGRTTSVIVTPGAYFNFPEARREGGIVGALISLLGVLVLVMACTNVMNLLLARGVSRRREIGIRLAIGASRSRLIEQLLTESLLLALIGGFMGTSLCFVLPPVLAHLSPVDGLQLEVAPDTSVLLFAALASLVASLVSGLAPAIQATEVDLSSAFKGLASFGARRVRPSRLRGVVTGVQVAGSTLLLVVALLFFRASRRAATVDLGYATRGVLAFQFNFAQLGFDGSRIASIHQLLAEKLASTPGVEGVGLVSALPLLSRNTEAIQLPHGDGEGWTTKLSSGATVASAGYFKAMNVRLLRGSVYGDRVAPSGEAGAVVSASFADAVWGNEDAIGHRFRAGEQEYIVTGIAADSRAVSLTSATDPFVYLEARPTNASLQLVVRATGSTAAVERLVLELVREADPQLQVHAERYEDELASVLRPARLAGVVTAVAGSFALLLALTGIYGVVSYAVGQRTRDIAVRLALGSTRAGVVALTVRQGVRPVFVGIVAGMTSAVAVSLALRDFLIGISPPDPVAYLCIGGLLLTGSVAAMLAPALRAANVDPARTLHQD